jgi:hypothetical protein
MKEEYQDSFVQLFRPKMIYLILAASLEIYIYIRILWCVNDNCNFVSHHRDSYNDNSFRIYNIGSIYSEEVRGFKFSFTPRKSSMTQRKRVWYRTDLTEQREFSNGETSVMLWLAYGLCYPGIVFRFQVSGIDKSIHARDKFSCTFGRPVTCFSVVVLAILSLVQLWCWPSWS